MKKGLNLLREGGAMHMNKEMQQTHDQRVMMPVNKKELTLEERKSPL